MNEERQEIYKILELGTDEKNLHKHKNTGGLLYIDLSMIKFSNLSSYIRKQDKEIERLNNIINGTDEILKEHINECREELNTIMKGNDLDYINECSREFDVIRKNIEIIMEKLQELKENK